MTNASALSEKKPPLEENRFQTLAMDFLIDKQISSFCPDQSEAEVGWFKFVPVLSN